MNKHSVTDSVFVELDDSALESVAGAGLFSGDNNFALIDLSNLLGLGPVGVLGDASSSTTTTTDNSSAGLFGGKGLLGLGILGL